MHARFLPHAGRAMVGIAYVAFGIAQAVHQGFVTRAAFVPPSANSPLAAICIGLVLLLAGAAIAVGRKVLLAAAIAALIGWGTTLFFKVPELAGEVRNGGLWTLVGKGFALPACALIAAAVCGAPRRFNLLQAGALVLGAFLVLAAVQHVLYAGYVAMLVPSWIPGALLWTYVSAAALFLGGVGLWFARSRALAAGGCAVMIFSWVWLLHLPRALADVRNANETVAVFEALCFSGACLLIALQASRKSQA